MSKNFLVGIGGTGARVLESVIYMCSMGYGPEELTIFMVDPDAGNGNLEKTRSLITSYQLCYDTFHKPQPGEKDAKHPLFKTKITVPDPFVWEIFEEKNTTLSSYINYTNMYDTKREQADFASLLFSDEELNTKLNEGFRGHPSIGAVVMANLPEKSPFNIIWDNISDAQPNDARVFLVGSVFGGTGAAGFPTFGAREMLKFNDKAKINETTSRMLLGGALVLPYFSFAVADTSENMFVTNADFPIATKAALQYYDDKDLGFDQLYFIGDSLNQKVGNFSVGSKTQKNLPHYIEIVAGLSAFDFFEQEKISGTPDKQYFVACREGERLSWKSLPFTRKPDNIAQKRIEFQKLLCKMTVFASTFSTYGIETLNKHHKDIKKTWYKVNFKFRDDEDSKQNPRSAQNKPLMDGFQAFTKRFLYWISAIDESGYDNVELIDKKSIAAKEMLSNIDEADFQPLNPFENPSNIGALLKGGVRSENARFEQFENQALNNAKIKYTPTDGASKYIYLFYEAASLFSEKFYTLN